MTARELREQVLDDMELERQRGITIKARAVAIDYTLDGQHYELNLIDTPATSTFNTRCRGAWPLRRGRAAGRRLSRGPGPDGRQRLRGDERNLTSCPC